LVKGGDWDLNAIVGKDFVESYGGRVVTVPITKGFSTTEIINKIRSMDQLNNNS
jgi:bifunctional ADP-heptose synthase (sugar kinase/adenylyltransferase)